jgi:hypothetical protein
MMPTIIEIWIGTCENAAPEVRNLRMKMTEFNLLFTNKKVV